MRSILTTVVLLVLLPAAATAKVHEYRLDNGLKVIVKEDHRAPIAVSQVWYKVGASYEPGGVTGVSHALEHMMFKGTKSLAPGEFSRIIAANGGRRTPLPAVITPPIIKRSLRTGLRLRSSWRPTGCET